MMEQEFPTNRILKYNVGRLPGIPGAVVLEIRVERHRIDPTSGPIPTRTEDLSFLLKEEEAFDLGSALTFAARFDE